MQHNRKIGEKSVVMGRPLGKDGCKQTIKKSSGEKTSRTQEKGKATVEMGGLRDDGYEKIREDERWRGGLPIENYGKKNRKSGSTIL